MGKLANVQEDLVMQQHSWQRRSRFLSAPTVPAMGALKHLVRHLKGQLGVVQVQSPDLEDKCIRVRVDSNFAPSTHEKRHSKDCVHAFVYGVRVYNSSKDQGFMAQSSGEAELAGSTVEL